MSYEVRVPESLLLAPLPGWVKMIWVAIRSYQGRGDACYAKYEMIGERTIGETGKPTDKGQVSRAVSTLVKAGFLERITGRSLRCLDPAKVDQESTLVNSAKVDQESTEVDQESTPSKNQHRKPKKKTNKISGSKEFSPDSWQHEFSSAHLDHLKRLGIAPLSALRDEPKTIQRDADVFDKLHRLDGHSLDEIRRVMRWLFDGSWWVESGNYASAKKLRDKKGDQTYFEKFKVQSQENHANNGRSTGHSTTPERRLNGHRGDDADERKGERPSRRNLLIQG